MATFANRIRISKTEDLQNVPLKTIKKNDGKTYNVYDLSHADLRGANLHGANLHGADLYKATLVGANLKDADLEYADLTDADLINADLEYANLTEANLIYANLTEANLIEANLIYANLKDADLTWANLRGAHISEANLEGAYLIQADLQGADLRGADLQGADLQGADLRGVYLTEANLRGADLTQADLTQADLTQADLTEANLQGANLQGADLTDVIWFDETAPTVPQGVAYEVHRKSHELESNAKFLNTIGVNETPRLESFNYDEVQTKFVDFINDKNYFKVNNKTELIENLKKVIKKAKSCEIPTSDKAHLFNKAIEFAFQQDSRFTEAYIEIFIDETFKAYSSGNDNMSCVAGIKERFYTSLLGAALQMDTIEGFVKTPKLRILFCIAKTGKVQKDPNEILQQWAKSWEGKDDEWKKMKNDERKEHFKNYMMEEYKKDECYEENQKSIDSLINEKAKELDYVFENNEEAAQFGGRKRKNKRSLKKRVKSMKNTTKRKRSTRKARQHKKKHITRKAKQNKKTRSVRK